MIYFSAKTGGFYDSEIHGVMPDDIRSIEVATHNALLEAQASGMSIAPDENGDPIAIPTPPPPVTEIWEAVRRRRDQLLSASDFSQMPDAPIDEAARLMWRSYRQTLRDLPATTANPAVIEWPNIPTA